MSYRYALCSEVYKSSIDDTIRRVAELGFDGIEIAPFHVAESVDEVPIQRRREIRRVAEDAGVSIIGLHWLLVSPKGLHLTTADASVRERTSRYLVSLARFSADLGGRRMVLGSPKQRSIGPGEDPKEARARAAAALRPVAVACGELDIDLLLEPLNPAETNFLVNVEEALALAREIDHPSVGYILDCKAMSGMPLGIVGTVAAHGKGAGHFHANDPSGKGPGMGDLDFAPILSALEASGYEGWISSEPFDYEPDPDTVARTALRTLREAAGS